jgi:hypothetical protein
LHAAGLGRRSHPGLVEACLGLKFDPAARVVRFDQSDLPALTDHLTLRNLSLCGARVGVLISRGGYR